MADWTRAMVADRLELAAEVMKAAPGVRSQVYFNAWPEYFHSFADQVGQELVGRVLGWDTREEGDGAP